MTSHRRYQRKGACVTICLMASLIGCSQVQIDEYTRFDVQEPPDWALSKETVFFLPVQTSIRLEAASVGSYLPLPATPWGASVNVEIKAGYFAASGMQCFLANPVQTGRLRHALNLCRYKNGDWGVTRSVVTSEVESTPVTPVVNS